MHRIIWVLFLSVFIGGCYSEEEGCLDPNAKNFDVSADIDCCCEYPSLKLKMNYIVNDSTSFSKLKYYEDAVGGVYQIESFSFFLSHLDVKDATNEWKDPSGSATYWVYDMQGGINQKLVSNNVVLIEDSKLEYDFGAFLGAGSYSGVRFDLGLDEIQKSVVPDSLPPDYVLSQGLDSMWVSPNVYLQQKWVVVTDTSALGYQVDTFLVQGGKVNFELDYNALFILSKGVDYELNIAVDIQKWLEGIDWQANKEEIEVKLGENGVNSMSLVQ